MLAYSAVCGTGLDTVPPLSARLQPVKGKKAGDKTDFDSQYLFNTTLHPAN